MKLSLSTRIFLGFALMAAAFGGVLIYTIVRYQSLSNYYRDWEENRVLLSRLVMQIDSIQAIRKADLDRVMMLDDPEARGALSARVRVSFRRSVWERARYARVALGKMAESDGDRRWAREAAEHLSAIEKLSSEYEEAALLLLSATQAGEEPGQRVDAVKETNEALTRELRQLISTIDARASEVQQVVARDEARGVWFAIAWGAAATVLAVIMMVMAARVLGGVPILRQRLERIAGGDYTTGSPGAYRDDEAGELSRAIDAMAASLSRREREASETSEKLIRVTADLRRANKNEQVLRVLSENILRSIRSAIVALDEHGAIVNANPAAEAMWGIKPRDGAPVRLEQVRDWGLEGTAGLLERVMLKRETVTLEAVRFGRGGGRMVDVTATPLEGEAGELRGALLIGEDVTEKVKTKQQLIQSERLAAIGRLAAQMTHEVRNPLSSIGLNAELLEETLEGEGGRRDEAARLLASIQKEIVRLTEITEEYLRLSKPSPDRLKVIDLPAMISDLGAFMSAEYLRGRVDFKVDAGPCPKIEADPNRLRQVFINLVRNAMESMRGGGVMTVRTGERDGAALVEISDTGTGIPAESLPRLFDLFYSTKETGFGLGLPLARQIVAEYGGTIEVKSEEGKGSVFTVVLPASQAQNPGSSGPAPSTL